MISRLKEFVKFKQITNQDRLSQNTINSIIQDSKGFMWFGSQDGLNRYDGYDFKVYKKDLFEGGNSENLISSLFEDTQETLWVGTYSSGIVIYDKISDKFIKPLSLSELESEYITSIVEDNNENIWIAAYYSGLYKFNLVKRKLTKIDFNMIFGNIQTDVTHVNSLSFDKAANKLYIGIYLGGFLVLDLEGDSNKYYHSNNSQGHIIKDTVICVYKDSSKNVWIGTLNGLYKLCEESDKFEKFEHSEKIENSISGNSIKSICEDQSGNIWIGTYGYGLNVYDKKKNNFVIFRSENDNVNGFISDTIFSLYVDRSDVLWIGTLACGLLRCDFTQKLFYSIANDNNEFKIDQRNKIRSINVPAKDKILIGTYSEGLYYYKKENEKHYFTRHPYLNENSIFHFSEDNENNIWVANYKFGLCRIKLDDESITYYHNIVDQKKAQILYICLCKFDSDLLLIGTKHEGLKVLDIKSKNLLKKNIFPDLQNFEVRYIHFDSNNNLWIATRAKGLMVFKNISISKKCIEVPDYISLDCGNTVWCIHEDSENNIWAGTSSNGIYKINPFNNTVICFNEDNGLINNCIHAILEDHSMNLWLSTNNGLSKFNTKDKTFKNYDTSDGLNNLEFNEGAYFKYKDGTMYFGGNDGITYFHPDDIKDNPYIPNIVLTDFEIFNQTVSGSPDNPFLKENITYAKEINLTYKESVFSFRFAALIFNNPQKNQYAYKMEGFDKDWTYCQNRKRVTYTNLNPGDYVFRVKGSNNDGIWNEEGTSIKIHISPPYWKTWWFKGLGFLSLMAATGYSYRQRLEKLEKEAKAQEEFSRKLIESQETERKRIAHELHDTLAHDVLISKNKALMALRHKDDKEGLEKTLEEISEMASSTITDIRNISYDLHPHQLDRLGFTKTIKSIINEVSKSTNINFVFETDNVDEVLTKESEINLFRVIQESISNIIKHSKATEAMLKVSRFEDYLLITLVDNGKGFDVNSKEFAEARQGFGLSGIAERLKFMKGEAKIDSEINKGTTLKFKIPIKPE